MFVPAGSSTWRLPSWETMTRNKPLTHSSQWAIKLQVPFLGRWTWIWQLIRIIVANWCLAWEGEGNSRALQTHGDVQGQGRAGGTKREVGRKGYKKYKRLVYTKGIIVCSSGRSLHLITAVCPILSYFFKKSFYELSLPCICVLQRLHTSCWKDQYMCEWRLVPATGVRPGELPPLACVASYWSKWGSKYQ